MTATPVHAVDLIIRSRNILTPAVLEGAPSPGFLAIDGGKVAALGSEKEAPDWEALAKRVVNVGDATVCPGLIDSHIHPIMGATLARGLDLSGIRDREQLRSKISAHATEHPDGWLLGWGLDPIVFGERGFSNDILDNLSNERLALIALFDGHSAVASHAALRSCGVTGKEMLQDTASVGLGADGQPNGMLYENSALQLVSRFVPPQPFEELVDAVRSVLTGMAETGLVAGHVLDFGVESMFDVLDEIERTGDLPVRLRISPWLLAGAPEAELVNRLQLQGRHGRRWHVRGVKLMLDGTIDNGTAWLFEPDTEKASTKPLWNDVDQYVDAVRFFHDHRVPTTTHAIGDKAIAYVADTIASLSSNGTVHRIEHLETLPDDVLNKIIASGATTSMQPTHCTLYTRADHTDTWSRRLGHDRANLAWRTNSLRRAGAVVALGSDWPIAPWDPRPILASSQSRRPPGRPTDAPIAPEEGLSGRAALEGYTTQFWDSVGEVGGSLTVGALADITVLQHDPLHDSPMDIETTTVLMTIVEGEIVTDNVTEGDRITDAQPMPKELVAEASHDAGRVEVKAPRTGSTSSPTR